MYRLCIKNLYNIPTTNQLMIYLQIDLVLNARSKLTLVILIRRIVQLLQDPKI